MVGNDAPLDPLDQPKPVGGPRVKTFECPSCGASVAIRTPGLAMSFVCDSCKAVIGTDNENYFILSRYFADSTSQRCLIELGSRGTLQGKTWECIGFMVRAEGSYEWDEYLLFNPYYGYRWLTQNRGHWSIVQTIKKKPTVTGKDAYLDNKSYRLYGRGPAKVIWVRGEFYFRVVANATVQMADYIAPPYMLSEESDKKELVWSISEYIQAKAIRKAFKIPKEVVFPKTREVGPNQPTTSTTTWNEIWKLWLLFIVFLTVAQIFQVGSAGNVEAFASTYNFVPNSKVPEITTPVFKVKKDQTNLAIEFNGDVENSWVYVGGELVNDTTGETYPIDQNLEYYHGVDGGESWSEGSHESSLFVSKIPAGDYYMNLDVESGDFTDTRPHSYWLKVKNDVPTWGNYFWCLFFLAIMPIWTWTRSRKDELSRWSNSDYAPISVTITE